MKLSLAWIYDHIEKPTPVSIKDVLTVLNEHTAEVDYHPIKRHMAALIIGRVASIDSSTIIVATGGTQFSLPYRPDVQDNQHVCIYLDHDVPRWAHMGDFGSNKETLLPVVHVTEQTADWQTDIPVEDSIIEISHTSITHRPDLWSHRGFARELCAIFGWQLKPIDQLLYTRYIQEADATSLEQQKPFGLVVQDTKKCRSIAYAYVPAIGVKPSILPIMARLCAIDSRPINTLVDLTNYVMSDIGQPMHAFDAANIDQHIMVRKAEIGETVKLLDGDTIQLSSTDLVIADNQKPVSLAGIMGGLSSSIKPQTRNIILESGSFDPHTIRHSVLKHKKRTEASMRYEKDLDLQQAGYALARYLYLLHQYDITYQGNAPIYVLNNKTETITVELNHAYLEKRIGTEIPSEFVISILSALGFHVCEQNNSVYQIHVPSYRTKDIHIKEDIIEEVARFWGYKRIPAVTLLRPSIPADLGWVYQQRSIKKILQTTLGMHEIASYAFFDESWLNYVEWQPTCAPEVQQPISNNWKRLVTSLIPHLAKAVHDNAEHHPQLRFFEYARTWGKTQHIHEKISVAGIWADTDPAHDFYYYKSQLELLFTYLGLSVTWKKYDTDYASYTPWFMPTHTAIIMHNTEEIGLFGMISPTWQSLCIPKGSMAAFELNGRFLRDYIKPTASYTPLPKFPDIHRDTSILVPLSVTAQQIEDSIGQVDARIADIRMIDFFHKKEWGDHKSMTFSFIIRDPERTLTSSEIDVVCAKINKTLQADAQAEIR